MTIFLCKMLMKDVKMSRTAKVRKKYNVIFLNRIFYLLCRNPSFHQDFFVFMHFCFEQTFALAVSHTASALFVQSKPFFLFLFSYMLRTAKVKVNIVFYLFNVGNQIRNNLVSFYFIHSFRTNHPIFSN